MSYSWPSEERSISNISEATPNVVPAKPASPPSDVELVKFSANGDACAPSCASYAGDSGALLGETPPLLVAGEYEVGLQAVSLGRARTTRSSSRSAG